MTLLIALVAVALYFIDMATEVNVAKSFTPWSFAALILALYGLYSVMRYIVLQRRREIGIRMALGARQCTVMKMIVRYGLKLSFIGGALGFWGALSLVAWLKNLSPGLPIFDPVVYGGVLVVLTLVALAGASLPARSAARIEPAVALRGE